MWRLRCAETSPLLERFLEVARGALADDTFDFSTAENGANVLSRIKRIAAKFYDTTIATHDSVQDLLTFLRHEAWQRTIHAPPFDNPKRLLQFGYKVFSESDEDGIIAEIFKRIGTENRSFFEFGVGDGLANNTMNLLVGGWSGAWIDGSDRLIAGIKKSHQQYIAAGKLRLRNGFVTKASINPLIAELAVPHNVDLLSIDIDGNDYWIWEAIDSISPRVVVIEYNSTLRPPTSLVMEYVDTNWWNGSAYFGATLNALEKLGRRKGYSLVACNYTGVNAFFVRDDLLGDHFEGPFTAENHYRAPQYHAMKAGHPSAVGPYVQV